jgi:flagellin-like hook-associated protein FlgL
VRTTPLSTSRTTLLDIRSAAAKISKASQEVSSGLRVTKPSDDPADAAGIVRTRAELAAVARFRENLEAVRTELRAVDGSLFNATAALDRAVQLAAKGASDTSDAAEREMIAGEAEGIYRHIASIANTVHGGRYVFGGSIGDRPPFAIDEFAPYGITYQGDGSNRQLTFPDRRPAAVTLPGDAIFLTPDSFIGSGRTATEIVALPSLPVGIGLSFRGDVETAISVDLRGPFLASAAPSGAGAGDTVTFVFTADDGSSGGTITTPPLTGGEDALAITGLLNAQIAATPSLAGKLRFAEDGGKLKVVVDDSAGTGFSFTSSSSGSVITGLEAGGSAGGYSAAEIADALSNAVGQNSALAAAGVRFSGENGQVTVDGDVDFTFTAIDFDRGTGFSSGLGGVHRVGGLNSANVFGSLHQLIEALHANDGAAIAESVGRLQQAVDHVSQSQAFYGATLRQTEVTIDNLTDLDTVNTARLSLHQDADILKSIGDLQNASAAEQFALQVAARQRPKLLDLLG